MILTDVLDLILNHDINDNDFIIKKSMYLCIDLRNK